MREVFISHASQNNLQARKLRDLLLAHNIPAWLSSHRIQAAQQWQDEIGDALARCGWFVLLLTPDAVASMWVKRELSYALIEKRYQKRIIPLLFEKCNYKSLSWTLPQLQLIDFTENYRRGCEQLLRVWRRRLRQ